MLGEDVFQHFNIYLRNDLLFNEQSESGETENWKRSSSNAHINVSDWLLNVWLRYTAVRIWKFVIIALNGVQSVHNRVF